MAPSPVFGSNPFLSAQPAQRPKYVVDQEAQDSLYNQITNTAGGAISDLLWALDIPGAFTRGTLAGGLERGLSEALADEDARTSGRELLREYGLAGQDDNWGNFFGGLGAEIVLDPSALATGSIRALSGAGKAADAAGLMRQAPQILSRAYLNSADDLAPELVERAGAYTDRLSKRLGRTALSETDVAGRPVIGRRAARRYGTLGNLIDYAPNPEEAQRSVRDWLRKKGIEDQYDYLRTQRLGGDIGLAPTFMHDPVATFHVPFVGGAVSDALDTVEDVARWSRPGRALAALTQRSAGGAYDASQQAAFAGSDEARKLADKDARREAVYQAAKLYQGAPEMFSVEGNRTLGRLMDKPLDSPFQADDAAKLTESPAVRNYVNWWEEKAAELPEEFRQLGLNGGILDDPNVAGYLPRRLEGVLERERGSGSTLGKVLSTMTPDQMSRTDALKVPGGRDTLAFELSLDPFVAGPKRAAKTDDEAATHIAQKLYGEVTDENKKQGLQLARLLHLLPDTASGPAQLFAQHPTKTVMDYVGGRAGAKAVQKSVYDSLAALATPTPAPLVRGGKSIPLSEAINRFGARTVKGELGEEGARQQMRRRLAELSGEAPDKIELAKYSVPEEDINRLLKVRDAYEKPEIVNTLLQPLKTYNRTWKSLILAVPKRIVRDLYSGLYSNWLEGALDVRAFPIVRTIVDLFSGTPYVTARELAAKSAFDPEFVEFLGQMPRYASYPASDRAARYYADLAAEGLLGGGFLRDAGQEAAGTPMTDLLPGVNPMTWGTSVSPLLNPANYAPKKFFTADGNPIMAAGARAGNLSDTINRLTGYNSLLLQGVSPEEAARRMKRAHVDYDSLTPVEKQFRDDFMPFYAYTSRIAAEAGRQILERPGGRYGQGIRAFERLQDPSDDDPYTPEQLRQQFAAEIPEDMPFLGGGSGDFRRYYTDVDLPGFDQIQMLDPNSTSNTFGNLLQGLAPQYRTALELLSGQDAFTKEPINNVSRGYGAYSKLARAAAGPDAGTGRLPIYLDKAIDLIPGLSRPARTAASLLGNDEDRSFGSRAFDTAFNELGLGRFRTISKDRLAEEQIRRLEELASPYTKDVSIPSIPESMRPMVPKDSLDAFELARQRRSEIQKARRAAKKPGAGPGVFGGNPFVVQ